MFIGSFMCTGNLLYFLHFSLQVDLLTKSWSCQEMQDLMKLKNTHVLKVRSEYNKQSLLYKPFWIKYYLYPVINSSYLLLFTSLNSVYTPYMTDFLIFQ